MADIMIRCLLLLTVQGPSLLLFFLSPHSLLLKLFNFTAQLLQFFLRVRKVLPRGLLERRSFHH